MSAAFDLDLAFGFVFNVPFVFDLAFDGIETACPISGAQLAQEVGALAV